MTFDLIFDARHIRASGIGVYTRQQIEAMKPWAVHNGFRIALLGRKEVIGDVGAGVEIVPSAELSPMYSLREQSDLAAAIRRVKPKAFWTPHYPSPVFPSSTKQFVTVHDVLHALPAKEGGLGLARFIYARTAIKLALSRSQRVFVPSHATKRELIRLFGDNNKVCVAPMRIDPVWSNPVDESQMPNDLPARYVVYVGNVKRHKNLLLLLRAFEHIQEKYDLDLVLAGGAANVKYEDGEAYRLVDRMRGRVHVTGNLPFESLRAVVAKASFMVMPSLYEGVGLPPLEAMAVGTPVLASDIPSLRETCGDAAAYFDPRSVESLVDSMARLLEDPDQARAYAQCGKAWLSRREASINPCLPMEEIATLSDFGRFHSR